jgi:predicted RNase H-like nuclease
VIQARPGRRSVGVDLAWGLKASTGLAVLDSSGDLLDMVTVHSDDDIAGWVRRHAAGDVVVAFDAPLVVTNETGMRECERLVGRYFGRFGVSCHASSRSNPAFADGGRAARLASRLGLGVDPWSPTPGRAIEVYPHTAIVQLFGLGRLLGYKHRPGRDVHQLSAELTRLLDHLESLETAEVPMRLRHLDAWRRLRDDVSAATRKHQLRAVEDAVDAVVCLHRPPGRPSAGPCPRAR